MPLQPNTPFWGWTMYTRPTAGFSGHMKPLTDNLFEIITPLMEEVARLKAVVKLLEGKINSLIEKASFLTNIIPTSGPVLSLAHNPTPTPNTSAKIDPIRKGY